jgi:hypothetical protein
MPPPEYDRPYDGVLVTTVANSQKQVREWCPDAKFTLGVALACTHRYPTGCRMVIASDKLLTAAGFPAEMVKRHELAHCNGWPADHPGPRPFVDWAE